MPRVIPAIAIFSSGLVFHAVLADDDAPETPKEALQALQDYIGSWKGSGFTDKDGANWQQGANWSWRFKGNDCWLTISFPKGKFFRKGEMRYLQEKERYQLTLLDPEDNKLVFEGPLKKGMLILERKDPETKETQQLKMNMAGGGIRSIYTYLVKPENRTLYSKRWQIAFTKEGESFATATKKIECIVTGGLGTMAVSFQGVTYYVCCSGCRDAFNENPEKYVKAYLARKKGKS